ncbi:hypothetical protein MSKU15_3519 [Komagataeibacter diospyri]|uniref:hypothetical protein n=1 Tax=Komagataeibacter diospyri TaxID=1932662 RepID=UPI0011374EF6|nr:hypothetical protein [Komagataeibacter diospyri]GCE91918.1 hypothetical protein MSKU15_3519 [Komagataeibacter diospyri]
MDEKLSSKQISSALEESLYKKDYIKEISRVAFKFYSNKKYGVTKEMRDELLTLFTMEEGEGEGEGFELDKENIISIIKK